MFVPYPFRPFWQPNPRFASPLAPDQYAQLERLNQKLDTAEKKINEYAQLIASLYAELKRHQDTICVLCKEKISCANLATASRPTPSAIISELAVVPVNPGWIGATSAVQVATGPPLPGAPPYSANAGSGSEQPQPTVMSSTSENAGPTQPDWSVQYNPDVKQTLSLHVANTFTFTAAVYSAKFSRDGKYLALGLANGETHVYNMITGSKSILVERSTTVFYTEEPKAPSRIEPVQFSPDSKYIVTGAGNGRMNIWEIAQRRVRASFKAAASIRSLDFSSDGRLLVSASYYDSVCIWGIRDGSRRILWHRISGFVSVAFSPDGRSVAAGSEDGLLKIWDTRTGQQVATWSIADPRMHLRPIGFTRDGKGIASGSKILRCWDVSTLTGSRSGRRVRGDTTSQMKQKFKFKGHTAAITAISFSSDDLWVVSSSLDRNVCISDAQTGSWVCTLRGHADYIWGTDFSPAGHYIVSGGEDRQVLLWRYNILE